MSRTRMHVGMLTVAGLQTTSSRRPLTLERTLGPSFASAPSSVALAIKVLRKQDLEIEVEVPAVPHRPCAERILRVECCIRMIASEINIFDAPNAPVDSLHHLRHSAMRINVDGRRCTRVVRVAPRSACALAHTGFVAVLDGTREHRWSLR